MWKRYIAILLPCPIHHTSNNKTPATYFDIRQRSMYVHIIPITYFCFYCLQTNTFEVVLTTNYKETYVVYWYRYLTVPPRARRRTYAMVSRHVRSREQRMNMCNLNYWSAWRDILIDVATLYIWTSQTLCVLVLNELITKGNRISCLGWIKSLKQLLLFSISSRYLMFCPESHTLRVSTVPAYHIATLWKSGGTKCSKRGWDAFLNDSCVRRHLKHTKEKYKHS